MPATPPPARRTARSALAGLGRAPRTSGGPVNGPSRRTWGFVFAIAGMIGVALAAWGGQPLLGGGLGLIAVAGCIAPPGVPHDPRSRTVRAAGALSAGGVLLVAADLVVGLL